MKYSDAADDVQGSGVAFADAEADAEACGDGEFHVIAAGADDVDSCGDAAVGCCGEAVSDSTWLRSCINSCSWQ